VARGEPFPRDGEQFKEAADLIIFLQRHAEAEIGPQMDPTRKLTDTGRKQSILMGKWLSRQSDAPQLILQSNMKRSQSTAKRVNRKLDVPVITTGALDPEVSPELAWRIIRKLAFENHVKSVLAVSHGPLVERLLCYLIGCPSTSLLHFAHGAIAHFDTLPPLTTIEEATGEYTYDEQEMKRWVLGSGGASGVNCEDCEEAADRGWVDMDEVFGPDDVDDAPMHPNCDCTVEQKTRRVRVYESGLREAVSDENPFRAYFHWLVTPNTVARDEDEMDAVTEAALAIADSVLLESAL
jgi:phosphohistidine phosphatase